VDVDLVVFNVTVTDGKGRPVSGLRATDFHIDEEGRGQDVALFDASDVPASVGLIVDNSGSMIDKRAEVINAALTFVAATGGEAILAVHRSRAAAVRRRDRGIWWHHAAVPVVEVHP
jgi:VWFA-related protein